MTSLIAYHNDPKIKQDILLQLQLHYDADEIIQGTYWQNGKGCAVGCTIHCSDHSEYEVRFGIPLILARLEDKIFERLPNKLAKDWPLQFMNAVNVGADLSAIWKKFIVWLLSNKEFGVLQYAKTKQSKNAIKLVCDLYEEWIIKEIEPERFVKIKRQAANDVDATTAAAAAAGTYTYTAGAAAAAAVYAAAYAAEGDAIYAATYAGDAYYYAAVYAGTNHYIAQSQKLLELLRKEVPKEKF